MRAARVAKTKEKGGLGKMFVNEAEDTQRDQNLKQTIICQAQERQRKAPAEEGRGMSEIRARRKTRIEIVHKRKERRQRTQNVRITTKYVLVINITLKKEIGIVLVSRGNLSL